MALLEGQVQVRDLVMGPGTDYTVVQGFNPFDRRVRAEQSGARAWNHGSWSGAEWVEEAVVPLYVAPAGEDVATWLLLHQRLMAAFAPVGAAAEDVELRWALGGREFVMFGRPRMVESDIAAIGSSRTSIANCAFIALDPLIYSGTEESGSIGLPQFVGGLTVPFTVPLYVTGSVVGGEAELTNEGTAPTPLSIRLDGPLPEPRVTVHHPDGDIETLRVMFDLSTGQWLDIDTGSHAV